MAQETCSSSSSSNQTWSYEVFVSFYGKDTRLSFTDHLFAALDRSGIDAFRDNRDIERGEAIWPELEKAIESSRIAIIVFSRNYAASRWCLDELVKIMECKKNLKQIVMPVFYDVDPSDVRYQKGSLEIAFAGHEERFEKGKVERWRNILTEVANLAGEDLQNVANRFESNFIEKIIDDIFYKLNEHSMVVAPNAVGIESRVQYLYKLLSRGSSDVYMVGIWGIGGIGKTTIAKALYNLLQRKFKASCFLENIGEAAKQPNGLIDLQDQLLSSVHVNNNRKIKLVDQGTMDIQKRAWSKRVLVVLDDVDHWDQLDKLAIKRGCFQPGSVIIITTRNKSMLKLDDIDVIYTPPILDNQESIKLLSWYAFDKDHPKKNYEKLSKEVINYAQGLPLTLKVLGSFLSDKSTTEWEGTLEQLRAIPFGEIQEKLMVSFYSLSDTQKDLFLDIACFFIGMEKNHAFKIIHDSNSVLESELGVLVRQCLVTIDCSNRLTMHDIIRDMGREVVRRKSPKVPRDRSRLWNHTDVVDALGHHKGGEEVEGIMIDLSGVHDNLEVDAKAFANMHQLRVLQLNYARLKGNFQCPSKRLRYLEWYGFPMKSIPADIYMENLVALYMPYSSLRELWTGNKILKKLKFLDVNHSYHLRRTPDFSGNTNLEVLVFNNCTSLVCVHESVTCLDKLVTLDLEDCKNLRELPPGIHNIKALEDCKNLRELPLGIHNIKALEDCKNLRELPLGIHNIKALEDCKNLRELPRVNRKRLFLNSKLPSYLWLMSLELPLHQFGYSSLIFSKALKDSTLGYSIIAKSAGTHLSSYPQPGLEERAAFAGDDGLIKFMVGFTMNVKGENNIFSCSKKLWAAKDRELSTAEILKKLKFLDVNHSYHLRRTPDFSGNTNLEVLVFNNCTRLVYVHKSVTCLDKLVTLDLEDCKNLRELPLGIHNIKARVNVAGIPDSNMNGLYKSFKDLTFSSLRLMSLELPLHKLGYSSLILSKALKDFILGCSIILKSAGTHISSYPQPGLEERAAFAGDDNFGQQKTENFQWKQRRLQSVKELLLDSQDADIWTYLGSIFRGPNWNLLLKVIVFNYPKKNFTSLPRKKPPEGIIALGIFSVFLPGGEFPDWFDYKSTGSILSFVVPPRKKQMIRGWFFCVVFASRFHEINGFTLFYELKNITKNITWHYRQQDCRVVPCQEHMWLHSVPLYHAMADLLEAGDEVEYSIQFIGSCRPKIFGVNLIYENDKKDFRYFFEAMIQNAYLHEDVSTDKAKAFE